MNNPNPKRPFALNVLMFLLLLLGISALGGGIGFLVDPSGQVMGIPLDWLETTPFNSYLIPGMILFIVLGIYPVIVAALLYFKPPWSVMRVLEQASHQHWAWLASLSVGMATVIWVVVQFLMLGVRHPIQIGLELAIIAIGFAIIAISVTSAIRRHYALS